MVRLVISMEFSVYKGEGGDGAVDGVGDGEDSGTAE